MGRLGHRGIVHAHAVENGEHFSETPILNHEYLEIFDTMLPRLANKSDIG